MWSTAMFSLRQLSFWFTSFHRRHDIYDDGINKMTLSNNYVRATCLLHNISSLHVDL